MKVAFDISQTGATKAGCGYLAYSLGQELARQPSLDLTFLRTFGPFFWDPANLDLTVPGGDGYLAGYAEPVEAAAFWGQSAPALAEALNGPDIIHCNNFYSPAPIPGIRQVYTLYDMTVFDCPQYTTDGNRSVCMRGIMHAACNADAMIAISEASKAGFLDYFPYDPDRITVIPLGSRFAGPIAGARPAKVPNGRRFILAVGTIEPRKNYDILLQAFRRLADQQDVMLVIAGKVGWNMESFDLGPTAIGLGERVRLLSYVSDEELAWLYEHCTAFVYPSLWEGFGLPVLEALSRGCAVISSKATSLPEVTGEAALLFDPARPDELADRIALLLNDEPTRVLLRQRAKQQAALFSWASAARLTMDVYQRVLELPPRTRRPQRPAPAVIGAQ
jgi:glycosyltransferase involved in cell wall biosynthesis